MHTKKINAEIIILHPKNKFIVDNEQPEIEAGDKLLADHAAGIFLRRCKCHHRVFPTIDICCGALAMVAVNRF